MTRQPAQIKVVVVPPNAPCDIREIGNDLDTFHKLLKSETTEGWCEAFRLHMNFLCVVNEEGALPHAKLPLCRVVTKITDYGVPHSTTHLYGQFFVCKQKGAEWVSLTDREAEHIKRMFDVGHIVITPFTGTGIGP